MNFFFKRKLAKQLRATPIPVREEFLSQLRTSLVNRAEEDHGHSFVQTMKRHKKLFSLSIIPLGIAIAIFALQVTHPNTPGTNSVLDIPAVLAESIVNTFQLNNTMDFTHQQFLLTENVAGDPASDVTIDLWKYQENSRMRMRSQAHTIDQTIGIDSIISNFDDQSCTFSLLPKTPAYGTYTFAGLPIGNQLECNDVVEVDMAPLAAGDLALDNVHVEDVSADDTTEGADAYVVWTTKTPMSPEMLFSINNSGYADSGSNFVDGDSISIQDPQPTGTQENGVYTYRAALYQPAEPDTVDIHNSNIHLGGYNTILAQVKSGDQKSAVYQIHFSEKTVDVFSAEQLVAAQDAYKRAMRTNIEENQSPNEVYTNFFQQALDLKDQLGSLTPVSQTDELYQGQQATRVRYDVPVSISSEEFLNIAQVEFVVNTQDKKVLQYQFFGADGTVISSVSVQVSEIVIDTDPATFFTVAEWKKDVGAE